MKKLILAVFLSLTACADLPHDGDPCDVDSCDYENPGVGLFCVEGSYKSIPCAGGCSYNHKGITCDPRGSTPGTLCPAALGGLTTCGGNRAILSCYSGIWQVTGNCAPTDGGTGERAFCDTDNEGVSATCVEIR